MLTPSQIHSLKSEFSLSQSQISQFDSMLKRVQNYISTPQLLKIYSQYGFNQHLLQDHVNMFIKRRLTESAFKKIHKQVVNTQNSIIQKQKQKKAEDQKNINSRVETKEKSQIKSMKDLNKELLEQGKWKVSYSLLPDGSIKNFIRVPV